MNLPFGKAKEIGILSLILIIILSYVLFFYLQNVTEQNIRSNLFEEQKERQIESTKVISQHIGSDLMLITAILQDLADSTYLQQGILSGDKTKKLVEEKFNQINTITEVDGLFIADKDNIITFNIVSQGQRSFVNIDISFRDYVEETRTTLAPTFSNGFEGIDHRNKVAIAIPIINRDTGEYIGLVGAELPTINFFEHYRNVPGINSQFLAAYDKNATILANSAGKNMIGKNFFGDYVQKFINHNAILNNLTHSLLDGNPGFAVYDYGRGERLATQYPIFIQGKPMYFIQIVTSVSAIYSDVNSVLFTERLKMFSFIAGTTAAISVLIVFLIKWNSSLNNEVKRRTKELDESNKQLSSANEQLKLHDKMQKEFINIAAHELRTPIQAILGYSELSEKHPQRREEMQKPIHRNAIKLQKLSDDILDASRIEGQTLKLKKEQFNLKDIILNAIPDIENQIVSENVKVLYEPQDIYVHADKGRTAQVISNLLSNAIKFTEEGNITITTKIGEDDKNVVVSIEDTGSGIDSEVLPKLFSKFVTKSPTGGTGLGLFISKNIIEAHGGRIWAENNNNADGKVGATFAFSLPIL